MTARADKPAPATTSPKRAKRKGLQPRLRFQFGEVIAFGPGKAELLEQIEETGSISAAARRMNMSYRRAWQLVETMNQCFRAPLVETAKGGKGGGGASISDLGKEALQHYRRIEQEVAASEHLAKLSNLLTKRPPDINQ